jgi:hypothetical protein
MEAMNPVTQLKRIDLAAPPPGKFSLELGKLGSELALICHSRKLPQFPFIRLGFKINSHLEDLLLLP